MLTSFSTPEYKSKIIGEQTEPWIAECSRVLNLLFFKTRIFFKFYYVRNKRSKLTYRFHYEDELLALLRHSRFFVSKKLKHPTLLENYAACLGVLQKNLAGVKKQKAHHCKYIS